ncbi:hypothetical protein [Pseudoduganella umbonata]|uniref:Uncharacterized protein n=1 Tax=Pseudoduganella umbonata TaxID=864828 RepID=A0A4P8HMB8_9BURK|nr:hypothetical protein [Pseudoduganella umbonata]MBB3220125.1 hypothetical protein [Pseudoduganella umbonata]QCP10116.1 hypothetical protein FCL38_06540 [Pseudoduganella umbonata]
MGPLFWIKRYLLAAVPLFAILAAVEWAKGTTAPADIASAAIWAAVAAAIFTAAAWNRYRKALSCAACDAVLPKPAAAQPPRRNKK